MDIIFSLDSVITALGMVKQLWIMVTAVVLAMMVMILFATRISHFVEQNPTIKMLALSFLILIGVLLVAEGFGTPVSKGYIYFGDGVLGWRSELLNMRMRSRVPSAAPAARSGLRRMRAFAEQRSVKEGQGLVPLDRAMFLPDDDARL